MNFKYYIVEENFYTKQSLIVYKGAKYDCLNMIEALAEEFIKKLQGNKPIPYYTNNATNRQMGYFIQKDKHHLDKLIVKHKAYDTGFFFATPCVNEVITYYIVPYIKPSTYIANQDTNELYQQFFQYERKGIIGDNILKEYSEFMSKMKVLLNELKENFGKIKKSD